MKRLPAQWLVLCVTLLVGRDAAAEGNLRRVNHIIIVMQENHSFDNYFGVLPYVPSGPYHRGPCERDDHACVDGLSCSRSSGGLACTNSNLDGDGSTVTSFHSQNYCPGPDLAHGWTGSHQEANFLNPALTRLASPNDGFVRVNDGQTPLLPDERFQADNKGEGPTEDDTMGYYDQGDLPFYYGLAQTFAISDRYFSSVIGPTFPNRSFALAATAFGHVTTAEIIPPLPPLAPFPGGYKPITGTIMDLLDRQGVSWTNYFSDLPITAIFRGLDFSHAAPVTNFFAIAGATTCNLPAVSFVDPAFGDDSFGTNPSLTEFDEHPPSDIRNGQFFVSQIVASLRSSACWKDSIVFITYDEHGGFYDHVAPARARQGGAPNPDGINPGQCADRGSPPASEQPGGGAQCFLSPTDAASICPGFTPSGPYPAFCAHYDQLGFRVPLMAVSPFSRRHYVSHRVGDHTSLLALIEKRFLASGEDDEERPHLTARDLHASTLEDMFDFDEAPSLNATVPAAPVPLPNDPGCPFVP
ncbi:MAG TPA: alkaline phosphatase family protein [Myxococcales bacterium]